MSLTFASRAPVLELRDPLAEVLGALAPGETFRYSFHDAVKLSGHSCPTVAGAYLMTVVALEVLYRGEPAVRGDIEVVVGGAADDGTSGPMAQVIGLVTGAATETGFGGLLGRWRRRHLLRFDPALDGHVRFRRADTGATVEVEYDPHAVAPDPELNDLLVATLRGRASSEERERFGALWQARVEAILTGDPRRVIHLRDLGRTERA